MSKDYLAVLAEIPAKHGGLLFEQIQLATMGATGFLRTYGLSLPGETKVPTYFEVRMHLGQMINRALDGYFTTREQAPQAIHANEIWGEDGDGLFTVVVTALGPHEEDGYTADIDMNLLYGGQ